MKKIFYLIVFVALFSCAPRIIVNDNIFEGEKMFNAMNGKYSLQQFDSMCVADTLPIDLLEWEILQFKDYEEKNEILLYSIYKKNIVYRVEKVSNDSVKIIKRQVK